MIKVWFLLIIVLIFLLNCQPIKKEIESNYKRNITITDYSNDSFYVQGKKYYVIFECDSLDLEEYLLFNKSFYCFLVFFNGEDDRTYNYQVVKLTHLEKNIFQGTFTIPDWASRFMVSVQNSSAIRFIEWFEVPIAKRNGDLEEGAIRCFFQRDNKASDYESYVQYELTKYQNYLIFAAKWFYELENKLIKKENLIQDVEFIKRNCNVLSTRLLLLFIGNYLLKDSIDAKRYLDSLSLLDTLKELNNSFICSFLQSIFPYEPYDSTPFNSHLEKFLINNPNSLLFHKCLEDGSYRKIQLSKVLQCINYREAKLKLKDNFNNELAKFILFTEYRILDSLQIYLDKMVKYLSYLYEKNYIDFYPSFNNNLYIKKALLLTYIYQAANLLGNYEYGIEVLKKGLSLFEPFDFNNFFFFSYIADNYYHLNNLDSSLYYYLLSYKLNPTNNKVKEKINKIIKRKNLEIPNLEMWLINSASSIQLPANKILDSKLFLDLDETQKVYLCNFDYKTLILCFFTTNCSACIKEILFFNKVYDKIIRSKIAIFLVSQEDHNKILEFSKKINNKIPIVNNGYDIIRYFNIKIYPTTIIIGKQGVINNFLFGFDKSNESLFLNLIGDN